MLWKPMGNVVVRNTNGTVIRLKDVAYIEDSYMEQTEVIRTNGKEGGNYPCSEDIRSQYCSGG